MALVTLKLWFLSVLIQVFDVSLLFRYCTPPFFEHPAFAMSLKHQNTDECVLQEIQRLRDLANNLRFNISELPRLYFLVNSGDNAVIG